MKELRVGVLGLGIGMRHARTVQGHPAAALAALCDPDTTALAAGGKEFPQARLFSSPEEFLDAPDLDVVCIASPDDAHFAQARGALERGRHVFVEKPLCQHEGQTRSLAELLARRPELRLSSNLVLRTCPRFLALRQGLEQGRLGTLYHIEADYFWGRKHKLLGGWRAEMDFYSIIQGAAVHMVDLALFLTGRRPLAVTALGSDVGVRGTAQRHNAFAVLLLRFADGLSAKIAAHGGCEHPHFHRVAAYGERGVFQAELAGAGWIGSSEPEASPEPEAAAYPGREERGLVLASFLDALRGSAVQPLVSQADSFAAMSICHAADRSVATGQECPIEYLC
ncbi:MAG: hypothetical protein CVU73_06205 [Deltaproteobacteria bacterium HGW-Deltaproteobacteria-8]|jgi:predicted dehydrogenase|nr:MAG: hypothetical protein CVU73_06205 [Deltaproteobacteria bacterium HGW-Deltaproteobacteria-8]